MKMFSKLVSIFIIMVLLATSLLVLTSCSKQDGEVLSAYKILNQTDEQKFAESLANLKDSQFKGVTLIKQLYYMAFSVRPQINDDAATVLKSIFIDKTAENASIYTQMVVPSLYGGTKVPKDFNPPFDIEKKSKIEKKDILPGDILCVASDENGKFYATDGARFFDLTETCKIVVADEILDKLSENDLYAVLRPALAIESKKYFGADSLCEGETNFEKAIITTAKAFMMRGDRMQYADIRLVEDPVTYRWERGKTPEDYTIDETGYSNCTGFVHDVYYNALGWDYGSFQLANSPSEMIAYSYTLTHEETEEQKKAIEKEYKEKLKVGDIVFYTRSGNTHAMLYVGNGNMIHCTGGIYAEVSSCKEEEEAAVRYMRLDALFDPLNTSRYLFQTEKPREKLYIIRPSNMWKGKIPEATLDRIANMENIFTEKTCSVTMGQTVNAGEILTYTFTVENRGSKEKTVNITDSIPKNTILIESEKVSTKTNLVWDITLKPREQKQVSYTVKVLETAKSGTAIVSTEQSKVGNIPTKAPPVFVGRTLTDAEQEKLYAVIKEKHGSFSTAFELANEIYKDALGWENIFGADETELEEGLFERVDYNHDIKKNGKYTAMIAPALYGGYRTLNSDMFLCERTRMPREKNLVIGDIIYFKEARNMYELYIYAGDGKLLDLSLGLSSTDISRLEVSIGRQAFVVLRPSLAK